MVKIMQGNNSYDEVVKVDKEGLSEEEFISAYANSEEWEHYSKYYMPAFLGIPIGLILICFGIDLYLGGLVISFFGGCLFTCLAISR